MRETLILLVPLSILLVFVIGAVFWWATHSGQFDDLEQAGRKVIEDDDSAVDTPKVRRDA